MTWCLFSAGDGWREPLGKFPGGTTCNLQRARTIYDWNTLPGRTVGFPPFKVFTSRRRVFAEYICWPDPPSEGRVGPGPPAPACRRPSGRAGPAAAVRGADEWWPLSAVLKRSCRCPPESGNFPTPPVRASARAHFPGARPVIKLTPPFSCNNCTARSR